MSSGKFAKYPAGGGFCEKRLENPRRLETETTRIGETNGVAVGFDKVRGSGPGKSKTTPRYDIPLPVISKSRFENFEGNFFNLIFKIYLGYRVFQPKPYIHTYKQSSR